MKLEISASLNYRLPEPVDLMLQIEAADGHGQRVLNASLDLGAPALLARVPASGGVCEPNWLRGEGTTRAVYRARDEIDCAPVDSRRSAPEPSPRLPAAHVPFP